MNRWKEWNRHSCFLHTCVCRSVFFGTCGIGPWKNDQELARGSFVCFFCLLLVKLMLPLAAHHFMSCIFVLCCCCSLLAFMHELFWLASMMFLGKAVFSRVPVLVFCSATAGCISAACMRFARLYIAYMWHSHARQACHSFGPRLMGWWAESSFADRVRIERLLRKT